MKDKIFGEMRIQEFLGELDEALSSDITILMIGGGAMAIRGDKEATKDIDLVVVSDEEFEHLKSTLENQGFEPIEQSTGILIDEAYRKMDASIYRDKRGYWIDVFNRRICQKFLVSENVIARGTDFGSYKRLRIVLMSREDIFLAKSITERPGDLDDMFTLFRRGLDEDTLLEELDFQSRHTPQIWEAFMVVKLEEMEERFDITVPFKEQIIATAEKKMEHLISGKGR